MVESSKYSMSCFMIGAIVAKNTSMALDDVYEGKPEAASRIANAINELETNQAACLTQDYKENILDNLHEAYDKVKRRDFNGAEIVLKRLLVSYPFDKL